MDLEARLTAQRALCVEHLGERIGGHVAALARPGFELRPADAGRPATGRCQYGDRLATFGSR
ncbi:hypothetical protein ACFV2X_45195, partial [Streptomyces sp. NPDC059679]